MGDGKDKEHRSHRRDQPRASDNPLSGFARQALEMGGHNSSTGPAEAQQYSSTPAPSGYGIQQPRPAPHPQGHLWGTPSYTGGVSAGTAQYSGSLTSEPQSFSGGYSSSAHQQTTEEHKRGRESSSSSGDQQHDHEGRHHKHHRAHHKHKKPDDGSGEHHHGGHHGPRRDESQGSGRSYYDPTHQPGNQGANPPPPAPQYQPDPRQNTSWPTNAPTTAGYGYGGGGGGGGGGGASASQPTGSGGRVYGDDIAVRSEGQSGLPSGFPPQPPRGWFPPMGLTPPQLAPVPSVPRQHQRRDQVPSISMLANPPHLAPIATQPQPPVLPPMQPQLQRQGPMQPPVPTQMEPPQPSGAATGTGEVGQGAGPAAPQLGDPNFNVVWRGNTFVVEHSAAYNRWTNTQSREARVLIASFETWDEAARLGQETPGGRSEDSVVRHLKKDDAKRWSLHQWREWTREEDVRLWENRAPYPGEDFVGVATRIQPLFPGRMIGELVGRLKLFARIGKHPDAMGRTIGGWPKLHLKDKGKQR